MASYARMADSVAAECYALRHAGDREGLKPLPYWRIAELVTKTDKEAPSAEAVRMAVLNFGEDTASLLKLLADPTESLRISYPWARARP